MSGTIWQRIRSSPLTRWGYTGGLAIALGVLIAGEHLPGPSIAPVVMFNPDPDPSETWLIRHRSILTCSPSNDRDCHITSHRLENDSVTKWWEATAGEFPNGTIGTRVRYIAPAQECRVRIVVHADDDHAPSGNDALADEPEQTDTGEVDIVAPVIVQVGFGNDHQLFETPEAWGGWAIGTTPIQDPVYNADEDEAVRNRRNHVCFTKNAADAELIRIQAHTPVPLSEFALFALDADGNNHWYPKAYMIIAGQQESLALLPDSIQRHRIMTLLADRVWHYQNDYRLDWRFLDLPLSTTVPLNSTIHSLYLTYGQPQPSGAELTVQRLVHLCGAETGASGENTRKGVTDAIWERMPLINIWSTKKPFSNNWDLLWPESPKKGLCNQYAEFLKRNLDLIGVSGSTPYLTYASTDANVRDRESAQINELLYWLKFDFDRDGIWDNNFEGSIKVPMDDEGIAFHYYAQYPKLHAASELLLLRQIGPDNENAWQVWVQGPTFGRARTRDPVFNIRVNTDYPTIIP